MNKILLVIQREYLTRVKKKSFIVMTFLGPLQFIDKDGNTLAVVGWQQAQALWAHQTGQP